MPKPLLAVDSPSLLFRAFYALPDSIKGQDDRPVNALLGSVNMVLNEVQRHRPRAVVMCFGQDAADYRVEMYEAYHADRVEGLPDGLDWQFEAAPGLYEAFGWYTDAREGLEADDMLGSYTAAETEAGGRTLILTGDRDMFQCVGDDVSVLYMRSSRRGAEVVDAGGVRERYGIDPELVPDFIALRGDPSDGLPGAKGIGEKTAADLLGRHGSLEATIEAAGEERPRIAASLRDSAALLADFKEIATLRHVKVKRPADRPTDRESAARAAKELGMNRLAVRLGGPEDDSEE